MATKRRILPAGWYPTSSVECARDINSMVQGFTPPKGDWKAGVAPHAGWYFSGKAAARTISTLAASSQPDRVVIFGGHLSGGSEPIIYTEDAWETPFGAVSLDSHLAAELVSAGAATPAGAGFADNTVEIQIPFVRHFFPNASVIAVHSPASERAIRLGTEIAALLTESGLTAVFLGSSDLTHYGPNYGFTPHGTGAAAVKWVKEENDRSLIDKALAMDAEGVIRDAAARHNTCSPGPIASVVASVSRHGVKSGTLLEYYTSYDVMPSSSFVGYAAIVY